MAKATTTNKPVTTAKGTKKDDKPAAQKKADKPAAKVDKELARHPFSERYGPKMSDEELQGLADDIKAHGLHEPIIMYDGMVLAGWNRYKGCLLAGVAPDFRDLPEGKDPAAVAFGTNFIRRKLGSVQKAFYGAQFCAETGAKQADVAKSLACNLNRLNQCCQLLKRDDPDARKVVELLRDSAEMGSAAFDEHMLELGIAKEAKPTPPRPARAPDSLIDGDDDIDFEDDDITGGAIDRLGEDDLDDEASPPPATRKGKGSKPGEEIGDDEPLPAVGAKRGNSLTNPHETVVSRVASAFKKLPPEEQRQFVRYAWGKLRAALDAAISHGDVEYELPGIKPDPSVIARRKPAGKLDDGAEQQQKGKKKPAPKKPAKTPPPAKPKAGGKGKGKDNDI